MGSRLGVHKVLTVVNSQVDKTLRLQLVVFFPAASPARSGFSRLDRGLVIGELEGEAVHSSMIISGDVVAPSNRVPFNMLSFTNFRVLVSQL